MKKQKGLKLARAKGLRGGGWLLNRISILTLVCSLTLPVMANEDLYALTKVPEKGENTITKFEWNQESQTFVPVYYRLDLKTEYGEGDSVFSTVINYSFGDKTIKYFYDDESLTSTIDYNEDSINVKFVGGPKEDNRSPLITINGEYESVAGDFIGGIDFGVNTSRVIYTNYNSKINNISGNFISNGTTAVQIFGTVDNINGNFIGNKGNGGGVHVDADAKVNSISGNFIANTATNGAGGGVFNEKGYPVESITGNFVGNNAMAGGGIASFTSVNFIDGDFINNKSVIFGAAITNLGYIQSISGDFIGNNTDPYLSSGEDFSYADMLGLAFSAGGAIGSVLLPVYSDKFAIDCINGNFYDNHALGGFSAGGAIAHLYLPLDKLGMLDAAGIELVSTIGDIHSNFINNTAATGGAIANASLSSFGSVAIGNITGNFINNSALAEEVKFTEPQGEMFAKLLFGGKEVLGKGGAIFNYNADIDSITNSNFINNSAVSKAEDIVSHGGAIYTNTPLNIISYNGSSIFKDNYIQQGDEKTDEAIYVDNTTLNLSAKNKGTIYLYDSINGSKGYTVNLTGDNTGKLSLYNDIKNANVTLSNTTLDTINNDIHTYNFNTFTVTGNAQMLADVDLANEQMDKIESETYGSHTGIITVAGMNLLSDSKNAHTEILFAEDGLKDNVSNGLTETNLTYQTTAYTPIYKYGVSYENREDGGYFLFDRAGAYSSNSSDSFNPAVLDAPVSTQAGTQSALNETVRFAFQHMDMFSQMPSSQRMALINQNKYAIKDVQPKYNSDFEELNKGYWVKPFTSFESINLHNGPSVDAITYGTLVGFDGDFRELKHDWYNVQSLYAGYIGSQMSYTGVDSSLNGGVLGLTETFYKGNFFGALTATAGASLADSSTMYGNEDFTSLLGGVGAKTGYNFEFKNGRYILQPIMFMNYSFVNTFDYTNAAKVRIKSDPLHTFQINPQLKFIANLDKGWQPYASVGFIWNVLNSSKVRANDVILPKMSVDPYVEYGLGIQRNWRDRFTGFAQAMVRNGGRNGVALTFGFRWALGNEAEEL